MARQYSKSCVLLAFGLLHGVAAGADTPPAPVDPLPNIPPTLPAPADNERMARSGIVQQAMDEAKACLQQNKPTEAITVLEKHLFDVNGNSAYLDLMKEAYTAYLRDEKLVSVDPGKTAHVRKQMAILDPGGTLPTPVKQVAVAPLEIPPPLPTPSPPPEAPVIVQTSGVHPLEQTPLEKGNSENYIAKAVRAFQLKQYAEADRFFRQAQQAGETLAPEQKTGWGYARLWIVDDRRRAVSDKTLPIQDLIRETEEAMALGGPSLQKYGQDILSDLRSRGAKSSNVALPDGWRSVDSANFRVLYLENKAAGASTAETTEQIKSAASQVAEAAEQARKAAFAKWAKAPAPPWKFRCDIYLHGTAEEYAAATHKPSTLPGHSTVGLAGSKIETRRIFLHRDDAELFPSTLPHEVAYVVLSDLFPDQPLPQWAIVGMAVALESPSSQARYTRALRKAIDEKKLIPLAQLLPMQDFPEAARITSFYAQSVCLVDYLVLSKGSEKLVLFLRELPRRGLDGCLKRYYDVQNAQELQDRWLKRVAGTE